MLRECEECGFVAHHERRVAVCPCCGLATHWLPTDATEEGGDPMGTGWLLWGMTGAVEERPPARASFS